MNERQIQVKSEFIGEYLAKELGKATKRVHIVSPFITKVAFDQLIEFLPKDVSVTIITRWRVKEVAMGISQPSIMDSLDSITDARIFLQQNLHAKVYVIDDDIAAISSANVTEAGLSFSTTPNLEAAAVLKPAPTSLLAYVRRLELSGIPATQSLRFEIEKAAEAINIVLPQCKEVVIQPLDTVKEHKSFDLFSFPKYRHPEILYQRYRSIVSCSSQDERDAVLDDLSVLSVPDDLSEANFIAFIAERLMADENFKQFDAYLTEPRRFGEMTDWLKSHVNGITGDHRVAQRRLQAIIRWLCTFIPNRYKLEQPNYSEIFSRIQ